MKITLKLRMSEKLAKNKLHKLENHEIEHLSSFKLLTNIVLITK